MGLTEKTTHATEALARFLGQDQGRTLLNDLISLCFVPQIQEIEQVAFDILEDTVLATAVGQQLDNLGTIVDQDRNGQSDTDYRDSIQAKIIINSAQGTLEEMIAIVDLLTGGGLTIRTVEDYPAHFDIIIDDPLPVGVDGPTVANLALRAKPAGVKGIIQYHIANPFQYDGGVNNAYDNGAYGGANG